MGMARSVVRDGRAVVNVEEGIWERSREYEAGKEK